MLPSWSPAVSLPPFASSSFTGSVSFSDSALSSFSSLTLIFSFPHLLPLRFCLLSFSFCILPSVTIVLLKKLYLLPLFKLLLIICLHYRPGRLLRPTLVWKHLAVLHYTVGYVACTLKDKRIIVSNRTIQFLCCGLPNCVKYSCVH